jgi:hypothetical protein
LAIAVAGCGGGSSGSSTPTHAQVRITSLLVGLSTTGLEWDSVSRFASHFRQDIASALLSGDPYAAAGAVLSNVVADLSSSLDAPDPVVTARIYVNGTLASQLPATNTTQNHDTFFPTFSNLGWTGFRSTPTSASSLR